MIFNEAEKNISPSDPSRPLHDITIIKFVFIELRHRTHSNVTHVPKRLALPFLLRSSASSKQRYIYRNPADCNGSGSDVERGINFMELLKEQREIHDFAFTFLVKIF